VAINHPHMMIRRCFLLLPTIALLAACDTPPGRQTFATLTFQDRPPLRLDVAQVEIVEAYKAPGTAPNVDHLFPQKPVDVAAAWGRDVLRATGERGMATYTVVDASATQTALPRTTGMSQLFKTEQSDRYDLRIEVTIGWLSPVMSPRVSTMRPLSSNFTTPPVLMLGNSHSSCGRRRVMRLRMPGERSARSKLGVRMPSQAIQ
jgi:hypothetical protein